MRRVDKKRRARERRMLVIKTLSGVTIGTVICSFFITSPVTRSYFVSSANAQANVSVAQFNDLIKYSFEYGELKNMDISSSVNKEEAVLFNKWLLGHKELNYTIENNCFLELQQKETGVYPTDKTNIPDKIINPKLIKIYAGKDLKVSSPVVYFNVEGDIKNYIEPLNPIYLKKDGSIEDNKSDIKINLNFSRFIKECKVNPNSNITGTITIGYLNSYKYDKIPVEFTKQYLLYELGRELFDKLNSNESVESDNSSLNENASKGIIGSYYQINDNQKQMIDMILPNLTKEIEVLISNYNDLNKKYNDLLIEKNNLEKEIEEVNNENISLSKTSKEYKEKINELNIQIGLLNSQIDTLKSSITTATSQIDGQ